MKAAGASILVVLLLLSAAGFSASTAAPAASAGFGSSAVLSDGLDEHGYWSRAFGWPGVDNEVYVATIYQGCLIVGGNFTTIGSTVVNGIARWDGVSWSPLGSGIAGPYPSVNALAVYQGKLVVGGCFATAGGVNAPYMATWDGAAWSPFPSAPNNTSYALYVDGDDLYAGGEFTQVGGTSVNYVARWDGSMWQRMGTWPGYGSVHCFCKFQSQLLVGGYGLAEWDGQNWTDLSCTSGTVLELGFYAGKVVIGGRYRINNGDIKVINLWDGATWSELGTGIVEGYVADSREASDGTLVISGQFNSAGGIPCRNIARWDGEGWSPFDSGLSGRFNFVYCVVSLPDHRLAACGSFDTDGIRSLYGVAYWTGTNWQSMGLGLTTPIYTSAIVDDHLFVGGEGAYQVVSLGSDGWIPVGAPLNGPIRALANYQGHLVAGGWFTRAGDQTCNYVALLDQGTWRPLGTGMNSGVFALTQYMGNLVAGGSFTSAGGNPASRVALWNGQQWSNVDIGFNDRVSALAVYRDSLVAAGQFTSGGHQNRSLNHVAKFFWNEWQPCGSGTDGPVLTVSECNEMLAAGGQFQNAGGAACSNIGIWDGHHWMPAADGVNGDVIALAAYRGNLIVGGRFTDAGDLGANHVARWNGASWSPLAAGVSGGSDPVVRTLAVLGNELHLGGSFEMAGGMQSYNVAVWQDWLPAEVTGNQSDNPERILLVYPNPTHGELNVDFALSGSAPVRFSILDVQGRCLGSLQAKSPSAGGHTYSLGSLFHESGRSVPGVYFIRVESRAGVTSKRVVLLK